MNTSFQYNIQVTIDDKTIDYLLTVDETGHVYEAKPMIYELPEVTQKLILGHSDGQLERKIDAFAQLIQYLLPLSLAKQLTTFQKELSPILTEIRNRLADRGMKWQDTANHTNKKSKTSIVCLAFGPQGEHYHLQMQLWKAIISVIENRKTVDSSTIKAISYIAYADLSLSSHFLPAIIPFLRHNGQSAAFEELGAVKSEAIKNYLLNELELPFNALDAFSGILKALHHFPKGDKKIYDAIIRFYDNPLKKRSNHLTLIIRILAHYPTPRAQEIGFAIIKLKDRVSANFAVSSLLMMGVSPTKIVATLMPYFKDTSSEDSTMAYLIFSGQDQLTDHLPDASEVLNTYVDYLSKHPERPIIYSMPALAHKVGIYGLSTSLFELLKHKLPSVRQGIVHLISSTFSMKDINQSLFFSPKMLERYLALIDDANEDVAKEAVKLLGEIGLKKSGGEYIAPLVTLYRKSHQKTELCVLILESICKCLHRSAYITKEPSLYMAFQHLLEPLYIMILEKEKNADLKAEALRGLSYHPEENFKKAFIKYENDPNPRIAKTAKDLFHLHYEIRWGKLRKKKPTWWKDIFKKRQVLIYLP